MKEEYLEKFKADALAASGALFDLGLAYEANAMWREAAAAWRDGSLLRQIALKEAFAPPPDTSWDFILLGQHENRLIIQGTALNRLPSGRAWP